MAAGVPDPDFILRGPEHSPVTCLQHLQQESLLLSGHQNGKILIWDLKTRRVTQTIAAHNDTSVLSIAVAENRDIVSQGRDGTIHRWNVGDTWSKTDSLTSGALGFCACKMFKLENNEVLAIPSENKSSVEIHNLSTKKQLATLAHPGGEKICGMCMAISVFTNGKGDTQILTGYENGSIALWDASTWQELSTLNCHSESVMAMDYNSEINKGFSATALDTVVQWEIQDGKELKQTGERKITNPGVGCLSVRKDGKLFVTGGWDSQARLFGCKKMKPLAVLSYHSGSIQCARFLADNTLVLGSKDGSISFWSLYI